jgi:hypothetical protein
MAFAVGGMIACDDPVSPVPREATFALPIEVFALTGGPVNAPSAVRLATGSAIRAEALNFDVAFDIVEGERVALHPIRTIASPAVGGHRVGMQVVSDLAFEAIESAPRGGYRYDSLLVVSPGTPVIIESSDPAICGFSFVGNTFYAKLVVDSLNHVSRQIWSRITVNPNCGSRSLAPGVPRD